MSRWIVEVESQDDLLKNGLSVIQRVERCEDCKYLEGGDRCPDREQIMSLDDFCSWWVSNATCKIENRPSDARTTTKWVDMPESPNDAISDDFRTNVDESLTELNREIMQCETDIQMLWDAIDVIKARMPREWGR